MISNPEFNTQAKLSIKHEDKIKAFSNIHGFKNLLSINSFSKTSRRWKMCQSKKINQERGIHRIWHKRSHHKRAVKELWIVKENAEVTDVHQQQKAVSPESSTDSCPDPHVLFNLRIMPQ